MARQLTLLDTPPSWQLDDHTRAVGRRGVAEARASLRAALTAKEVAEPAQPRRATGTPSDRSAA